MSLLKFVVVHSTSSSSYDQLWGGAAAPAHRGADAAPAHRAAAAAPGTAPALSWRQAQLLHCPATRYSSCTFLAPGTAPALSWHQAQLYYKFVLSVCLYVCLCLTN